MWVKRIALENHGYISILGIDVINQTVVNIELAAAYFLKAGNHTKSGGLSTAGGTNEYDELAILNLHIKVLNGNKVTASLLRLSLGILLRLANTGIYFVNVS